MTGFHTRSEISKWSVKMKINIRRIASSAVVAAIYAALTMLLAPISYGNIQLRVSEAMCILPFFFPYLSWGLFAGCFISNLLSPIGLADAVFGSAATLAACIIIGYAGKKMAVKHVKAARLTACLAPVVTNGLVLGAVMAWVSSPEKIFFKMFAVYASEIAAGEAAVMFAIGLPLLIYFPRTTVFRMIADKNDK